MSAQTLISATLTVSSVELLDFVNTARFEFNEASVRHNDFLSRCKSELEGEPYETFVKSAKGRIPAFEAIRMTADQAKLVAMRESKGVRRRVLARLKELEAKLAGPQQVALPQTYIEALEHLLAAKKSEQAAIAERDEAVRTKALIGSKREATAMAAASAAKREAAQLRDQLGFNTRHATVIAVEKAIGSRFDKQAWRQLKASCIRNGLSSTKVHDPRWGEATAWPAAAWLDAFSIDLIDLFGEAAAGQDT